MSLSEKENHAMIKKHSLFFDTNFRKAREKCAPEAIEFALKLAARITKLAAVGFHSYHCATEALEKFFDGTHCESKNLHGALQKAARVETVIYIGIYYSVGVRIAFFTKGQKEPFYRIETAFSKEGYGWVVESC